MLSIHAIHHKHLTHARWPHTSTSSPPRPLSQSQPTATHPPHRRQPALAANSMTHHTGVTGVMLPIDDNNSSPAPSHATCIVPCHMPPPPPLCAITIGLTTGHCPLRAAATIYIPLLPHSRCPHRPPFTAMHLTPMPLHFGPCPHARTAPHRLPTFPTLGPTYFLYMVCSLCEISR